MKKLFDWIGRVPVWVWLFLAATQALNLAIAPGRLVDVSEGLQLVSKLEESLPENPELARHLAKQREFLESYGRDQWFRAIGAAILLSCFLVAALWRWKAHVNDTGPLHKPNA